MTDAPIHKTTVDTLRALRDSLLYLIGVARQEGLDEIVTTLETSLSKIEAAIRARLV
jgi:hypothetical protein